MAGLEAIGEATTGGLAARAMEPEAGEQRAHAPSQCLNCGASLVGQFCHACGQRGHVHRTISAWWHDFLHGVLHLDGKFWRTLPMLAWRPGELTRRYAEGQRASFVSPLALFLFSVFLMFAMFSAVGNAGSSAQPEGGGIAGELSAVEQNIARLEERRSARQAAGADTASLERRIANLREEASLLRTMQERGIVQGAAVRVSDDLPEWLRGVATKAGENPALMVYKLKANGYKFSWALIPISVPFVWLLFLHRRRYRAFHGYDHVVFVTYSIAFMSLFGILIVLLRTLFGGSQIWGLMMIAVPPIHMYRQLRGAYGLSRFSALWRTAALLAFASVALGLFMALLLAIGAWG
jgi:hypothetical protein